MPDRATRANALDHVVVVLFENRSGVDPEDIVTAWQEPVGEM